MSDARPLQALRLPAGWTVDHNTFLELDPDSLPPGTDDWELLGEDLLQLRHDRHGLVVDVGWSPEASPRGRFVLTLIRGEDWANPLAHHATRSRAELVAHLEQLLVTSAR